MIPDNLLAEWRDAAEGMARFGASEATAVARCAAELEGWLKEWWTSPLGLKEAEAESGYTRESLLRFLREGKVPNAGTADEPAIPRYALPLKPGHVRRLPWLGDAEIKSLAQERARRAPSVKQVARSVATVNRR